MSNDLQNQTHVTNAADDSAEMLLQKIKSRLAELNALTEQFEKKIGTGAPQRDMTASEKANVNRQYVTKPDGFLIPDTLYVGFNTASRPPEGRVVPRELYRLDNCVPMLSDFKLVLKALANPATHESNRDQIFLHDGQPAAGTTAHFKDVTAITEGASALGINIAVLAAANNHDLAHLYVIEDKLRDKMLIAGPENILPYMASDLEKGGITYVSRRDPTCINDINNFLADAAQWRSDRGIKAPDTSQSVIETLIEAFNRFMPADGQAPVGQGGTVGNAIYAAKAPVRSVQITHPVT